MYEEYPQHFGGVDPKWYVSLRWASRIVWCSGVAHVQELSCLMDGTRGLCKEVSKSWRLARNAALYLAQARDYGGKVQKRRTGTGYIRTNLGSIKYKLQLFEPGRSA